MEVNQNRISPQYPDAQAVLDSLVPCEREVRTADGAVCMARIQPYRTPNLVIEDGADIGHHKMLRNVRRIKGKADNRQLILLAMDDLP